MQELSTPRESYTVVIEVDVMASSPADANWVRKLALNHVKAACHFEPNGRDTASIRSRIIRTAAAAL